MDPLLDTIDVQKTREILDEIAEGFDDSSQEAEALMMASFALFHGWHTGKFGDFKNDVLRSSEEADS